MSGDYYDFIALPSGRLAMLIADVCGNGMAAALLAASLQAAVRAYAPDSTWRPAPRPTCADGFWTSCP